MNGMKEIFGKEMSRVFKDKKMAFSVFLLPVIIMLGILYLMSNLMKSQEKDIENHKPILYIQNESASFEQFLDANKANYQITKIDDAQQKNAEKKVLNGEIDLLIKFPEGFDQAISEYKEGDAVPQIKTSYNPSEEYSARAYSEISSGTLEAYRQILLSSRVGNLEQVAVFTVNSDNDKIVIQDKEKAGGKALGMMLPYFITILLFAGAMGVGTDMIAGEKERGTMASLLVSPVKRSSIVLGKVVSLMAISGISSIIYVVAMCVFMPVMMKAMTGGSGSSGFNINLSAEQVIMLGLLLLALAFLYATIIALVSVFAKTVKEASTYVMPAYMIVLVVGMMTMYTSGKTPEIAYFIPLYNSSIVLKDILAQEVTAFQYGITLGTTLLCGIILMAVIVKAFKSEKVMAS